MACHVAWHEQHVKQCMAAWQTCTAQQPCTALQPVQAVMLHGLGSMATRAARPPERRGHGQHGNQGSTATREAWAWAAWQPVQKVPSIWQETAKPEEGHISKKAR
eukprot:1147851-Pelagomonas_calceolata.AAC.3